MSGCLDGPAGEGATGSRVAAVAIGQVAIGDRHQWVVLAVVQFLQPERLLVGEGAGGSLCHGVLLGGEVPVQPAMGKTGGRHEIGHTDAVKSALTEQL